MLEIRPVHGIGDVRPGDDLASLIADAAPWLRDRDILVVTSKIVSKAEGRLVEVPTSGPEREEAREEALTAETARTVARRGNTRIVQTHHGFVMAAAGIDASNVDPSYLVLLPKDPDASARALRAAVRDRAGVDVAVVVSDTMGRPWRLGLVDVALGVAGIDALRDHRGQIDPYGNELQLTQMAVADEVAAAAELVKGKCDGVPVAVVRGLTLADRPADRPADGPGAAVLLRGAEQDMFSLGTAEARALGLRDAATLAGPRPTAAGTAEPSPDRAGSDRAGSDRAGSDRAGSDRAGGPDAEAVARALALVRPVTAPTTRFTVDGGAIGCALRPGEPPDPQALVALGADIHRLRAALLAEGIATGWHPAAGDGTGLIGRLRPGRTRPAP